MNKFSEPPTKRELAIAVVAGLVVALAGLALSARGAQEFVTPSPQRAELAQESPAPSPRRGGLGREAAEPLITQCVAITAFNQVNGSRQDAQTVRAASCRIHNTLSGSVTNVGSGTLIDVNAARRRGLVLTCAHLFAEGAGRVVVEFPDGRTHGGLLTALDAEADLAAVEIANPRSTPAVMGDDPAASSRLMACGYGPQGVYRCVEGVVLGGAARPGQVSLRINGAVRSGDSGGGVFDDEGRLVGVVWGEAGGVTYASAGAPLNQFLSRALGRRHTVARPLAASRPSLCPTGCCPLTLQPRSPAPITNAAPSAAPPLAGTLMPAGGAATGGCPCGSQLADITRRLDRLERTKQDRGDYLDRAALAPFARADELAQVDAQHRQRHETMRHRLEALASADAGGSTLGAAGQTIGSLATTALGVSGPVGWGLVAGTSVGGWLLGRRLARRQRGAGGRRNETFQE